MFFFNMRADTSYQFFIKYASLVYRHSTCSTTFENTNLNYVITCNYRFQCLEFSHFKVRVLEGKR